MKNKPITLYWSPGVNIKNDKSEWSFLYPKPTTLFYEMVKISEKNNSGRSMLSCPAISNKFKKILVFKNSLNFSYEYDFLNNNKTIKKTSDYALSLFLHRDKSISSGPIFDIALKYFLFSDEPLDASFTSPFFHEPKYTKYGSLIPGEFNIGQWFRPFNCEIQTWNNKGNLVFEENEPLFYVELKTDRDIELKPFIMSEKLFDYANSCIETTNMFGSGQSLLSRYNKFKNIGLREKILTEINKNLIKDF